MDELKKKTDALKAEQIANKLPYLVADNVTLPAYNVHLESREDHFRYRWESNGGWDGKVWIIEVPSILHDRVSGQFATAVTMVVGDTLGSGVASAYTANNGMNAEADQSWTIEIPPSSSSSSSGGQGSSSSGTREKLTFVLEVGYSQSGDELRTKAAFWLVETTANEVVLIKINKYNRDDLWAEIWRRDTFRNPTEIHDVVQFIEFGGDRCTAMGQCVLQISLAAIYDGAGNIPQPLHKLNGVMHIDLFPIKRIINRHFRYT